jgi:enoyl-CoA hydratase/carnithine racemase
MVTTRLIDYRDKYASLRFARTDGVLEMALHTDGGPFVFSEPAHTEFGRAFADVGADPENRVVILTGTGDSFCSSFDYGSFHDAMKDGHEAYWTNLRVAGNHMLTSLLDIEVPVIGAVNGPALSHSEMVVMSDVVLAAEHATFQDATHFIVGIPPGDGMHVAWSVLLGPNRGRHFLMTGRVIDAAEALDLGVVAEVLPADQLLDRARELAARWTALPSLTLRGTRRMLTAELRRVLQEQLHTGLTYEALADLLRPRGATPADRIIDLRARQGF